MSYKYGDTYSTTSGVPIHSFDDFVDKQFRANIPRCRIVLKNKNDDNIWYYPDSLYIGEWYFIGKQSEFYEENRKKYPYGVYKLIDGSLKDDLIMFEDSTGNKIEVRPGTVILKKERIAIAQAWYGFHFPTYIKNVWPDLVERTENMPKPEYITCVPNKPGVRGWIDSILATIFWILGLLMFNAGRGGEFSFNFWGSTFYYLWLVVGGIFLLGHFWMRKK